MPKLFQYGRSASNQGAGIITRPTSGLNEYLPSGTINDNLMSDLIDVYPYRDECVRFYADATITQLGASVTAEKGFIHSCVHSEESTSNVNVFYLMTSSADTWRLIRHTYTISTAATAISEFTMTSSVLPGDAIVDSSCDIFKTEKDTYYVFSNTFEKRIHFVKHSLVGESIGDPFLDSYANTYGYADVPAYPKKIVSHANRIFFIDTQNKLWWCRAGDLYSWYSMEYDADAIVTTRNCANAAFALAAQPNVTRPITATVSSTDTPDTLGVLTLVGTNALDVAQTEVLTLAVGRTQSSKSYKTLVSATQSGWTQGGATPDTIVVGTAPVGLGYVTDDAGFWTLEQEMTLHDICVLGNSMYIFANHDIYIFQGYSPDSFSLQKIIADIGLERMITPNGYHKLTTGHNNAYFIYDGAVYEFDGNNKPRIISRPSTMNGQSINGIFGGINVGGESWVLASAAESLCVYDYTGLTAYYYLYNYEAKTWWKMSGILKTDIGYAQTSMIPFGYVSDTMNLYVPSFDRQSYYAFVSKPYWVIGYVFASGLGCTHSTTYPFIESKSYNTNPSETGSLTEVVLLLRGTVDCTALMKIQYSLTADADDFIDIKTFDSYRFTGDVEVLSVPVPVSLIANAHHYRIKIVIGNASSGPSVYLYNIERRFRVKGRSR